MMLPREDAYCPACPNPETAFRLEDIGMKFLDDGDFLRDDVMRIRVTRPAWEVLMIEHLRLTGDEAHRELYGQVVTALAGRSVEECVQDEVRAATSLVHSSLMRSGPR